MKIKVIKSFCNDTWYRDNNGDIYTVTEWDEVTYKLQDAKGDLNAPLFLRKADCEIIQEEILPPEPFDLERCKAGEGAITIEGWAASYLGSILKSITGEWHVFKVTEGKGNECCVLVREDGTSFQFSDTATVAYHNLFMAPKEPVIVTKWINVFQGDDGEFSVGDLHVSQEAAKSTAGAKSTYCLGAYPLKIQLKH